MKDVKAPTVVYLCGSTRFKPAFDHIRAQMTLNSKIVLGPEVFTTSQNTDSEIDEDLKTEMEVLALRKIDLTDAVFVVNPGNHIDASTKREIDYALSTGKPVYYHEEWYQPAFMGDDTFWQATNYPLPDEVYHEMYLVQETTT